MRDLLSSLLLSPAPANEGSKEGRKRVDAAV